MNQPTPGTPSLLRAINDRAALQALLERGPLTRPEIGALTGLSKPTASQLLVRLQEAGLVVLTASARDCPAVRRRSTASTRTPRTSPRWTSPPRTSTSGSPTSPARRSASTGCPPRRRPGGEVVDRVRAALEGAGGRPARAAARVVIGVQGALDPADRPAGLRHQQGHAGLAHPDLVPTLARASACPISVENNVNLVAQAEQAHGAGRGHQRLRPAVGRRGHRLRAWSSAADCTGARPAAPARSATCPPPARRRPGGRPLRQPRLPGARRRPRRAEDPAVVRLARRHLRAGRRNAVQAAGPRTTPRRPRRRRRAGRAPRHRRPARRRAGRDHLRRRPRAHRADRRRPARRRRNPARARRARAARADHPAATAAAVSPSRAIPSSPAHSTSPSGPPATRSSAPPSAT